MTQSMKDLQDKLDAQNPFVSSVGTNRPGARLEGFAQEVAVKSGMQTKVFNEMTQRHLKKRGNELAKAESHRARDEKKKDMKHRMKSRDAEIERLEKLVATKKANEAQQE